MIIDETTEIARNAELYAAKRYRAAFIAKEQKQRATYRRLTETPLEQAYNAAPASPVPRVTAQTSIPALDYVKRVARLYVGPVNATTLRELDHETTQIAIMGFKAIACVGLFLVFLAMTIG